MPDLTNIYQRYKKDIEDVQQWSESQYNEYFADHFSEVRKLYDRLKSTEEPITDNELEWILTWLPLELINVAEKLSNMKTAQETIKSELKTKERNRVKDMLRSGSPSETKAKEEAAVEFADDRMLISVYDSLCERVSRETTFAKELIMSSKKIWDARRNSEQPMPSISETDLPEYQEPNKPSTYIK